MWGAGVLLTYMWVLVALMKDKGPASQAFSERDLRKIETLRDIMSALRTPGSGCPWDLEQTFETIAPYTVEEAYEVADAIAHKDFEALREELGDLLLQVVYHGQMAAEAGKFDLEDVVQEICRKMIRRHPHVFGDEKERSASGAKLRWEDMKASERTDRPPAPTLAGVPVALPALTRANKLQAKAARVGFDWPSADDVLAKIIEECAELKSASKECQKEELGDVLFALVNLARHLSIDAESALQQANLKFERRFHHIEASLKAAGKVPEQSTLEEMDALWNEAKKHKRPG